MPTVQRYRETQGIGGLNPSGVNIKFDSTGLRAAAASSVPEKNAVPLIAAGADYNAGKRGVELQQAAAEYGKMIGNSSAHIQAAASRAEARAHQITKAILAESSARFLKMQEDLDASEVMKATNEWHKYVNEYWNDPEKGVTASRQLAGAEGCYKDTQSYVKELTSRISGKLGTNAQRIAFLKSVSGAALAVEERASRWEAQQVNKNLQVTAETTINNAMESVISDTSPTNFDAQLSRVYEVLDYQMRGAAPEAIEAAHKEYRSKFHTAIIESVIERDPKKAEQYYDAVKDDISEAVKGKLEKKVRDSALLTRTQEETPVLFEKYGFNDMAGAIKETRDNYSGKEEEFRVNAIESYWREQTAAREGKERNFFDEIIGMTDKHAPYSQVIEAVNNYKWSSNAMRVKAKEFVQREYEVGEYAPTARYSGGGGGSRGTDMSLLAALDEAREDGSLFKKYPTFQAFVEKFAPVLSKTDVREYRRHYKNFEKGNDFEVKLDVKFGRIYEERLEQTGVTNKAEQEIYKHNFNKLADYRKAQFKKEGKVFTAKDYIDLMNESLEPVIVGTEKTWYGTKRDIVKRRIDLPANARQGNDNKWYFKGEDEKVHQIRFKE